MINLKDNKALGKELAMPHLLQKTPMMTPEDSESSFVCPISIEDRDEEEFTHARLYFQMKMKE